MGPVAKIITPIRGGIGGSGVRVSLLYTLYLVAWYNGARIGAAIAPRFLSSDFDEVLTRTSFEVHPGLIHGSAGPPTKVHVIKLPGNPSGRAFGSRLAKRVYKPYLAYCFCSAAFVFASLLFKY